MRDREGKDDTYGAPRLNLTVTDFNFIRVLGEGSMSTVFHAVLKKPLGDHEMLQAGAECAMKVFDKLYIQRHKMTEAVIRERHIMDKLRSMYTARLKYTFQDSQKIYMAQDLYTGGDLFDQLQLRKPLPVDEARFYAAEMVLILQCLRENRVVFRDFKPENLLLSESRHLVLTDFGCAKTLATSDSASESASSGAEAQNSASAATEAPSNGAMPSIEPEDGRKVTFVGTADYLSPEVLKNTGCSFAVDLWGFGCVLFQMIAGVPPFRDQTSYLIMQRIDDLQYEFPPEFPPGAQDLVSKLLLEDPSARLGAESLEDLKNHSFFTGIEWATLRESEAPACMPPAKQAMDADLWEMTALQEAMPAPQPLP